jgi:transposase
MARELVDDALWEMVKPLLPAPPPRKTPAGRKRLDERRMSYSRIWTPPFLQTIRFWR